MRLHTHTVGVSDDEGFAMAAKMAPLGEVLVPEEVAGLVAYLASDRAAAVTGANLIVAGAWKM
jgi:NAD(P)-dependent dehydrogenase (short-subunit alcohol dehydrogenase family)